MPNSLATRLVDEAVRTIANATETHYTHDIAIDDAAGVYDCDCSGYLSFLIGQVAPRHLAAITSSTSDRRPLARDFYDFAAALPTSIEGGWRRIERLADAQAGDFMAWRLPTARTGDTGHCFVVADGPSPATDGSVALPVHDSTAILHFDDTRGADAPFATGIGSGVIHFRVDASGAPSEFRFDPRTGFETVPIVIARIEPFSAG